jgi:hypothetical protein
MTRTFPALGRIALLASLLAACAPAASPPDKATRAETGTTIVVEARRFGPAAATPPLRSNAEMARDFLDLAFRMESGRPVPALTRFEGQVTVALAGPVPREAGADLDRLLSRLRSEAGLPVRRASGGTASITVEFVPRAALRATVPQAACFVAPNVTGWSDYRAARRSPRTDWTAIGVRASAAIFIPADTSPQEVRDCLNEEIAQALGPLNDLYRLPDSVFNDDNVHGLLTGFDMLMLRAWYAPDLANGMSEAEVTARIPAVLARLNPRGGSGLAPPRGDTPRAYVTAVETALSPLAGAGQRRTAAASAARIAAGMGWQDGRAGFAAFLEGRLLLASDPQAAVDALTRADGIYRASALTRPHAAHTAMHLAAFALSQGQAAEALSLADAALPAASEAQNAALIAMILFIRSEALQIEDRPAEAKAVMTEALGWASYGFASRAEIQRRVSEIEALSPLKRSALR